MMIPNNRINCVACVETAKPLHVYVFYPRQLDNKTSLPAVGDVKLYFLSPSHQFEVVRPAEQRLATVFRQINSREF